MHALCIEYEVSNSKKQRSPNRGVALEEHYRTKAAISLNPKSGKQIAACSNSEKTSLVKINISIEEPHVKDCVMDTMSKRFSDFRSKAYIHYKKLGGGVLARKKPYKELIERPDYWIWLCNFFDSEIFKKKSESNSRNCSMLKFIHRMGTKSLVAHLYDQKLSRIELYKEFTDKEKKWVSEDCQAKYDKKMEIREKIIDDGGIVDETIICAEVLGETSSYIRGLGYGPKPIKKTKIVRSNASSERETELETSLKDIQEKYEEQSKIIKSQQKTIDWLKMVAEKLGMQPPNDDGITILLPNVQTIINKVQAGLQEALSGSVQGGDQSKHLSEFFELCFEENMLPRRVACFYSKLKFFVELKNLSIVIKKAKRWTHKLFEQISQPSLQRLEVAVEGPYSPLSIDFLRKN
ncbi:hypothetical protein KFK09_007110 [Dendrobium nobile]|uniref:Uncharacterized protein n=1 Tax=Dendrobium nobile TaxID=94219 RepID=A0A8T3BU93_DENNO|nr:hypothetical protein KFK09_007110 [Dendrobium nobile]